MRRFLMLVILVVLASGCAQVVLRGNAMTAAETSAVQAASAVTRMNADATCPSWVRQYAVENATQWRYFVRAAKKDETWGPKLAGE